MVIRDPYAVPGQFRKAQLHCHTTDSDGRFTPRELLEKYRGAGYSFVCITDHNRVTRHTGLDGPDFVTVPATEDTVSRWLRPLGPHMSRLFVDASLPSGTAQGRIDRTLAEGGIVGLCHPSWTGNLWTGAWDRDAVRSLQGFHLIEIWNPHSNSQQDLTWWEAALAAHGPQYPVWGVAVDDCHMARQFNRGWVMVKVPAISAQALRDALQRGAFYASTGLEIDCGVRDGRVWISVREPSKIRVLDASAAIRTDVTGDAASYSVQGDEGYLRVECEAEGRKAWSQPFWITRDS